MKVALGLDGSDNNASITRWARQGADEFFAGFIPAEWSEQFGWELNLNRRCFGPQWQYRDLQGLREAVTSAHELGRRFHVTFNSHQYTAVQLPLLRDTMRAVADIAPDAFIIADPALLQFLPKWGIEIPVHMSTGAACYNSETIRYYCSQGDVRRVIIPRKMTVREIGSLIAKLSDLDIEFEAMAMGGRCAFNDELCFCWHSGAGHNFCNYFPDQPTSTRLRFPQNWKSLLVELLENPDDLLSPDSPLNRLRTAVACPDAPEFGQKQYGPHACAEGPGEVDPMLMVNAIMNCGLCVIPRLREVGVNALKLITRGETSRKKQYLNLARSVLDHPDPTPDYIRGLLRSPTYCRGVGNCFYDPTDALE